MFTRIWRLSVEFSIPPLKILIMVFTCCVPRCRSNCLGQEKVSTFSFPTDTETKEKWIKLMCRENFTPIKSSRVCELHFEPSQVLREASAYDSKTGRTLTAPLRVPRLKQGAVPTLFMPPPGTLIKTRTRTRKSPKKQVRKRQKNQTKEDALKEATGNSEESQHILSQTDLETEFQTVTETPVVIKQEIDESADEPSELVIGNVLDAEELLPSSSVSSPSSCSSSTNPSPTSILPLVPEITLTILKSDDETSATHVLDEPAQKRKTNDADLDANDASPNSSHTKLRKRAKPSMSSNANSKRKLYSTAGSSKKITGRSSLPTENGENATREIFQSLLDGSEDNTLFGSRTSERPGDLFDVFSDFIADKLREMDFDDCAYALRAILDVVFNAGKGRHNSKVKSNIASPNKSSGSSDQE